MSYRLPSNERPMNPFRSRPGPLQPGGEYPFVLGARPKHDAGSRLAPQHALLAPQGYHLRAPRRTAPLEHCTRLTGARER